MRIDGRVKGVLIFASGAVVGGLVTWFAVKKYYRKKADAEIESVEKAFTDRINELEDEKEGALDAAGKALVAANDYHRDDPKASEIIRNKSTLDGILKSANAERVNYAAYYSGNDISDVEKNSKESIEVDDHPHDDGEDGDASENSPEFGVIDSGKSRGIYEISETEYGSMVGFDYKELYYYKGDGVMVDDQEEFIDNPEFLVGDVLEKSGFKVDDTRTIYIRNESVSSDFEVIKVQGTYA